MKFTFSWLKEHLDTKASVERIADTLTRIGLEVEELFDPATSFAPFRVAEVIKCEKHPNADKLSVCEVDTGKERLQVVCGAPNARAGMKGVFAPVGAYVPGIDLTLTKAKIRGVESHGMLLSERELELSDEHTGIIELDPKAKVGSPAAKALGLDDAVIEVAITPNRPDCLGVRGIARDLAAAGLGKLKKDKVRPVKGSFANPIPIELEFDKDSANACPVFAGRLVRNVKNGPSPEWLQRRLKAIGLRPINALVDITNYISYDRGRPLHVYDADKLNGAIRARLGRKGEKFLGLDGKIYEVDDDMCVIADDRAVLGLGGVIGGEETGVTEATTNVFIESAYFDPRRTARTGRRLGIQSDARFRFERGVDPDFVVPGLELATDLVLQICGGAPSKITVAGKPPKPNKPFKFDLALVKRLSRARSRRERDQAAACRARHRARRQGEAAQGDAPLMAPRPHRTCRSRRGGGAADRRRCGSCNADDAGRGRGKTGAHRGAEAATAHAAPTCGPRTCRGGDLVVHSARARGTVRRRASRTHFEQSDLDRACPDAAFAPARADRRRPAKPRQRLCRRRPVRTWSSLSGRRARASVRGGGGRSLRPLGLTGLRPSLVGRSPCRGCVRRQGRRHRSTRSTWPRPGEPVRYARGALMVSSRPLGRAQAWA